MWRSWECAVRKRSTATTPFRTTTPGASIWKRFTSATSRRGRRHPSTSIPLPRHPVEEDRRFIFPLRKRVHLHGPSLVFEHREERQRRRPAGVSEVTGASGRERLL